jgi:hypothetical protein
VFPAAAKIRGYAVRSEAVYDWKPEMLYGRTLVQELMATPPPPLGSWWCRPAITVLSGRPERGRIARLSDQRNAR